MIKRTAPETYTALIGGMEWQNITPSSHMWDEVQERIAGGAEVEDMTNLPASEPDPKLVGVEFEGVMCSATEADQNGLSSVLVAIQFQGASFSPTRFHFANGSTLVLTLENYQAFAAKWLPFRQSFFQP